LSTKLFPVQEGTLGVTSTRDLTIALPYFGDHRRFLEVSKHEMAHEFTIQKVRAAGRDAGAGRDPLGVFPLWFVEGIAE
jgi:predicted metalloprotease with PDZ domain